MPLQWLRRLGLKFVHLCFSKNQEDIHSFVQKILACSFHFYVHVTNASFPN